MQAPERAANCRHTEITEVQYIARPNCCDTVPQLFIPVRAVKLHDGNTRFGPGDRVHQRDARLELHRLAKFFQLQVKASQRVPVEWRLAALFCQPYAKGTEPHHDRLTICGAIFDHRSAPISQKPEI